MDGHERFGPYCGCRYVGRSEGHGDVEVWLLYDGQPHAPGVAFVGVLYGRISAADTNRPDHWIARPHRPAHQGDENAFGHQDKSEAAWKLWRELTHSDETARQVAAQAASATDCGGGCI